MLIDKSLEEIWDGRFYDLKDRVRVGCHSCSGCSECCRETGDSIILDPRDMYRLTAGIHRVFRGMIEKEIEIRLVDGLFLPNLMLHDEEHPEKPDGCPFLERDRCSIHRYRPDMCRLFPIARYYRKDGTFRYILQRDECSKPMSERYSVVLRDWIGLPPSEEKPYTDFIKTWHDFRRKAGPRTDLLPEADAERVRRYILQIFYVLPWDPQKPFYPQFEERMQNMKAQLKPFGI